LQDFPERAIDFEFLFDDGYKHVNRDGNPDLRFDRILGCAIESFDPKVLFDPFEKEFDPPTVLEKKNYRQRRKDKIVGQKYEATIGLGIEITDSL
jgi:hypothetical protein